MGETKEKVIEDAPFHEDIDKGNIAVYRGKQPAFVDGAFRGAAKTTRTKLFMGYAISNDQDHSRRYIKVLSEDEVNSRQVVTDVYNMFVNKQVSHFYPEILEKTPEKRAETMNDFETAQNVKMLASTVGVKQRGQLQDEFRPDLIWFDDFESRTTLRSALVLQKVWDNMEEARTGLSRNGGAIYTCNYISERGNVHKLIERYFDYTLLIPIKGHIEMTRSNDILDVRHVDGGPTWKAAYTKKRVEEILDEADDPAGEYLCSPAAGADIYFERAMLDKMEKKKPIKDVAGFHIYHEYDPSHRYGAGQDIAGGVGLDSSTSVFIDFTQFPARVVATFASNTIKPDVFGDEIANQCGMFGNPITAPENNKFDSCIGRLKQVYDNIFTMPEKSKRVGKTPRTKQLGWNTNPMSKGTMLSGLKKAISDGHLELSDTRLIAEARAYTRDDFMDKEEDPRLTTRHFDLLIACAIAYQMKDHAEATLEQAYEQPPYEGASEYEGGSVPQSDTITPRPIFQEEMQHYEQPPYEPQSEYES